jgi:hypothetical protein
MSARQALAVIMGLLVDLVANLLRRRRDTGQADGLRLRSGAAPGICWDPRHRLKDHLTALVCASRV